MIKTFSFIAVSVAIIFSACNSGKGYGAAFDDKSAVNVDEALKTFKSKGQKEAVVSGLISAVCQSEGCWFNYKTAEGELKVDFDHQYKIPTDIKGGTAIAKGHFYYDTTSVEKLKDWAKDDKKSEAEINKITAPEITLIFHADGVKLK